jgi:hypothetical protein
MSDSTQVSTPVQMTSSSLLQVPSAPLSPPLAPDDSSATTLPVINGWNSSHPHNTRFKKKFLANQALPTPEHSSMSSFDTLSALLALQDHLSLPNDNDFLGRPFLALGAKHNRSSVRYSI